MDCHTVRHHSIPQKKKTPTLKIWDPKTTVACKEQLSQESSNDRCKGFAYAQPHHAAYRKQQSLCLQVSISPTP